jgi:hypothetical protein
MHKKRVAEKCARDAIRHIKTFQIVLGLLVAMLTGLIAWVGLQESTNGILKAVGVLIVGALAFVGFWTIPDLILGDWMDRRRDKVYQERLSDYGPDEELDTFEVDWKTGQASARTNGERPAVKDKNSDVV